MTQEEISDSLQVSSPSSPIRYAVGVLAVMFASFIIFWVVMQPASNELGWMAIYLSGTALLSIAIEYVAYRTDFLSQSPKLRWTLLGGYALSSLLTFLNVWITARLMFTSQHDLILATILLIFASGIAMSLGMFLSSALTDRIHLINHASQAVARGELSIRIASQGKDEIADLARSFNAMAGQLQAIEIERHKLEIMRRDLIASVSHDLQTPLASMRVIVDALADGVVTDTDMTQRYLATLQKGTHQLSELIDDLFQLTQLDAGGLTLDQNFSSLVDLLSDTLESFRAQAAQQGIELTAEIETGLDLVYMDTRRIGRVLNNLISNALRHTPPGGSVHVCAEKIHQEVVIKVSDSGEGIAAEDIPHIFERFYRGEKSRSRVTGGAGLGLAIARGIIEVHGGEIKVESAPGKGSTFSFSLPDSKLSQD